MITTTSQSAFARLAQSFIVGATALYIAAATPAYAGDEKSAAAELSVMTPGLTAKEFARVPGVIFARGLADMPGKNIVVVALEFPPKSPQQSTSPQPDRGHRHPGSTYVYVTKGTVRLGIPGQPVQLVHAAESFF